ncbi:MAG: hypothetical protein KGL31_02080 [candidate division NC10 bacterium]|nr:hypothetical protein [candidate division NC10 bacterium]MDE2320694.1 hypothetical protein [candidate division NC10 bacterium]
MKKLLTLALGVVILVAFTGLGAAQQKAEERRKPLRPPDEAVMGQKDLCVNHKNDAKKYASCQNAVRLGGKGGGGTVQRITVCSGGYWWTIESLAGPITQGGPCKPEGAIQ